MDDFSAEVREALKARGFSLRAAARALHYDAGYLSRVLGGKQEPSTDLIQALNDLLGLDLSTPDETAATLAQEAGHPEIAAWCFETDAWRVLTDGDYVRAIELARIAQAQAPSGTSALIQATAQEGRAHARLGERAETYAAIERVQGLSAAIGTPDTPEHH